MPPAARRMLTPAISVEMAKSDCVTCRPQPPSWMRLGARLNEAQNSGMLPTSVGGGLRNDGIVLASVGSCGPGIESASGFVTFTAPCGGKSGFPNDAARAIVAATDAPPIAELARTVRRDRRFIDPPQLRIRRCSKGRICREVGLSATGLLALARP